MKIDILGVLIDNLTFTQVLARVEEFIADGRPHCIVTPYAESIVAAQKDEEFRRVLNQADLAVPDGVSLLMAAKFLKVAAEVAAEAGSVADLATEGRRGGLNQVRLGPGLKRLVKTLALGLRVGLSVFFHHQYLDVIKEEVKGTDLVPALCERAAEKGWRVFLLGGWQGVAELVAEKLKEQYNNLTIEAMGGSRDVKVETLEEQGEVKGRLSQFQPDLLFVSYGPVHQEKWVAKNLPHLSAKVVIGVAGALDMLAGRKRRAPQFLRRCGLEWLWRLLLEPSRLPRIFQAVVVFPWLVFRSVCR